ncbi:MAG: ATP-dependent DNA helicase [Candidatus Manganitrophaceae bacterium]|nr:MAG: ATP-dependent DNA helicase [Candidatus Manganitrophaceae bacterium]
MARNKVKDTGSSNDCQKLFLPGGLLSTLVHPYEYREAQMQMASAVAEALERRTTLLVEAPTGTGKTWAYLIPAALSGKRVVISTGTKTLQDQLYQKDLPLLAQSLPRRFTYSMMKGKANYLCLHRFGQFLEQPTFPKLEIGSDFEPLHRWSMETATGDRAELTALAEGSPLWSEVSVKGDACLGSGCPTYDRCYITRMKQAAAASDLIIVNHHLFFADLALKDFSFGEVLPQYDAVIFDEAHLLEEIATQYFGVSVSSYRVDDLLRDTEREVRFSQPQEKGYLDQCARIVAKSNHFFHHFRRADERYRLTRSFFSREAVTAGHDLLQSLDLLRRQILASQVKSTGLSHLAERIESLSADLHLFLAADQSASFVFWAESRKQGIFLHASPLDVSALLGEKLFQQEIPIILTSATLASGLSERKDDVREDPAPGGFDFMKERLGIGAAEEVALASPFDYEKQTLLYLPRHLPNPLSGTFVPAISEEIIRILAASQGRAFLLFTSWKNLQEVYRLIAHRVPYLLLKQGDQPKHALIESFRREVSSVLLGTTSFWQGIDVQGEALSCVVIDKLPFASPSDPLISARIESLSHQGRDPFRTFQLPSAVLTLRQGIGRLIRNRDDRGLLAILDTRLTQKEYGKSFLAGLPPSPRTDRFEEVQHFFSTHPPAHEASGMPPRGQT